MRTVGGGALVAAATPFVAAEAADAQGFGGRGAGYHERQQGRHSRKNRAESAYAIRTDAAHSVLAGRRVRPRPNADEGSYDDYRSSFHKTLPQNEFGEVEPAAFEALVAALRKGEPEALEEVPQDPASERGLVNPLASHAYDLIGIDGWAGRMPPAPSFSSAHIAAEMCEVYWQALTRDVPFRLYSQDADIAAAAADLQARAYPLGAVDTFTPQNLFRGDTEGEWVGPYISQLLWLPANWGVVVLDQRFLLPTIGEDFGLTTDDWLTIQRGAAPAQSTVFDTVPRHLATARDLAEYVHNDVSYQAYLTAALVMLGMGDDALDPNLPYLSSDNQEGFVTFGATAIADLVAKAANAALKAAWYQKWLVHRRLRPEVFAGRAHFHLAGDREYDIHPDFFEGEAVSRLLSDTGSLLLPLAFPEGSPVHPAYPAGHAAMAGACATILKAYFNESFEIPAPVEASADGSTLDPWTGEPLLLGAEINKLASNISIGRDAAGVHYRSDGIDGMDLGEQVAVGILQDYAAVHSEKFEGFEFTRFNGKRERVGGTEPRSWGPRRRRRPRWVGGTNA